MCSPWLSSSSFILVVVLVLVLVLVLVPVHSIMLVLMLVLMLVVMLVLMLVHPVRIVGRSPSYGRRAGWSAESKKTSPASRDAGPAQSGIQVLDLGVICDAAGAGPEVRCRGG